MFFKDIVNFIEQNPSLVREFPNNINISFGLTSERILTGTDNRDLLIGLNGRDSLSGLGNNDLIIGGAENDTLAGNEGDDLLIGNSGEDVAKYSQTQTDFSFKGDRDRVEVIGATGRDTLVGIESLEFSDGQVAIDDLNLLPAPLYNDISRIETNIPNTGDAIDIYLPDDRDSKLPTAILLPGANVDKSNYSTYLGSNDGISNPAETRETYDRIEDPPKALIAVEGTNHFGITNNNDPLNPPGTPQEVPRTYPTNNLLIQM